MLGLMKGVPPLAGCGLMRVDVSLAEGEATELCFRVDRSKRWVDQVYSQKQYRQLELQRYVTC